MNKKATALALTLMLLTGIVVGQLSTIGGSEPHAQPAPVSDAGDTAIRFYAALNTTLRTGDPTDLRAVLHDDFVDHSSLQHPVSADDLEAQLITLQRSFPGLHLTASATVVHNDLVASSLAATGQIRSTAGDLVIDAKSTGGYDLLRVAGSKVVERWSSPGLPNAATITSIVLTDIVTDAMSGWRLKVERIEIAPRDQLSVVTQQGTVIVIEAGSIGITQAGAASRPQTAFAAGGAPAVLEASGVPGSGAIIAISPADSYQLSNRAPETARLLHITLTKATIGYDGDIKSDISSLSSQEPHVNAQHVVDTFGMGQSQIVINLVHIGAGALIVSRHIVEKEFLVVMDGTVVATANSGELNHWNQRSTDSLNENQRNDVIAAPAGAIVNYQAGGQSPATFLLVSVLPLSPENEALNME